MTRSCDSVTCVLLLLEFLLNRFLLESLKFLTRWRQHPSRNSYSSVMLTGLKIMDMSVISQGMSHLPRPPWGAGILWAKQTSDKIHTCLEGPTDGVGCPAITIRWAVWSLVVIGLNSGRNTWWKCRLSMIKPSFLHWLVFVGGLAMA